LDRDDRIMEKFGTEFKQMTVTNGEKLKLIYDNWQDVHPNLQGYGQIVDVLVKYF